MKTYTVPGVHVEVLEERGAKPIEAVSISTAGFVGVTAKATEGTNVVTRVNSWSDYQEQFGGWSSEAYLPDAVYAHFNNGGGPCYVLSVRALDEVEATSASANIDSTGRGKSFSVTAVEAGASGNALVVTIAKEEKADEKAPDTFSLSVGGETFTGLTVGKDGNLQQKVVSSLITIDEVGTSTPKEGSYQLSGGSIPALTAGDLVGGYDEDTGKRTGLTALEAEEDIRLLLCPDAFLGYDDSEAAKEKVKAVQGAMIAQCKNLDRFTILDTPPNLSPKRATEWREYTGFSSSFAAMYYPWVKVPDFSGSGTSKFIPPSGHVVGVYNRTDRERGVHKAPANEPLQGVLDVQYRATSADQDMLNPVGVNCIRNFGDRGIRVWGTRTLESQNKAWMYVPVRRLFIMIAASLDKDLQWVVFEPNNRSLWAQIRRDIRGFLREVWRSGALFGSSPEEAFFIKCDDELNPASVRDKGQLIIEIGLAPVKPAEFVIVRLFQWAGPDGETE